MHRQQYHAHPADLQAACYNKRCRRRRRRCPLHSSAAAAAAAARCTLPPPPPPPLPAALCTVASCAAAMLALPPYAAHSLRLPDEGRRAGRPCRLGSRLGRRAAGRQAAAHQRQRVAAQLVRGLHLRHACSAQRVLLTRPLSNSADSTRSCAHTCSIPLLAQGVEARAPPRQSALRPPLHAPHGAAGQRGGAEADGPPGAVQRAGLCVHRWAAAQLPLGADAACAGVGSGEWGAGCGGWAACQHGGRRAGLQTHASLHAPGCPGAATS